MKKLIVLLVGLCLAAPSGAFAIQKVKRTGEIKMDESGGYSESQRDPHSRRSKQIKDKTGGGYYQGEYHNKSPEFKQGEWQFVDDSKGGSSKSKPKYKKVKETDKKKAKSTETNKSKTK
ncbi:MAG: hypothetical protein WC690_06705 [bacterium]